MNRVSTGTFWMAAVLGISAVVTAPATGQDAPELDEQRYTLPPLDLAFRYMPPPEEQPGATVTERRRFGVKDSEWWTFGGGIANNFIDSWDLNVRAAYSLFLIDDVEFSFEVNGWYFSQNGSDAFGLNPAIVFRWHLLHLPEQPWTVFADAGIGVLLASRSVPAGGTWFDFTPRVGAGYTHLLSPDGLRLQLGVRWHHISNARIGGDDRNPARDGVMLYGGIMIPF